MSYSSHPLPSTLILLNNLPSQPLGTKVRFLGCVAKYSVKTGLLALENHHTHHHQREKEEREEGEEEMVVALVDLDLVRGSMKATDTMRGGWVNVVGYVQQEQREKEKKKGGVRVQALMVWAAEGVRVAEYERAVEEREKIGKGGRVKRKSQLT